MKKFYSFGLTAISTLFVLFFIQPVLPRSTSSAGTPTGADIHAKLQGVIVPFAANHGQTESPRNTGTLIDVDSAVMGKMTSIPLQPGNIVEPEHKGESKYGRVMWSVESLKNFRVQVRFA